MTAPTKPSRPARAENPPAPDHCRGSGGRICAARILDGDYQGGRPLRQDALATEFGVSRIPVREALLQLEAEGLVQASSPTAAPSFPSSRPRRFEDLFEFRALLEPRLLRRSARHLTPRITASSTGSCDEYSAELRANHVRRWGELNTAFHTLLYRHAGQPRTMAIVTNLLQECDRHTRLQLS